MFKGEYRKAKHKQGKTGEQPSTWEFFDAIDDILGAKPSTRPPVVIDTSETTDTSKPTLQACCARCETSSLTTHYTQSTHSVYMAQEQ